MLGLLRVSACALLFIGAAANGAVAAPKWVTIDAPGASLGTNVRALSAKKSTVAGNFFDDSSRTHAYVRVRQGSFVTFDAPGSAPGDDAQIFPQGFDKNDNLAGYYVGGDLLHHGFLRTPEGGITTIDVPGSENTTLLAISSDGMTGGSYTTSGVKHGFVRDPDGTFHTFDVPPYVAPEVTAINNKRLAAGTSGAGGSGVVRGFLRAHTGAIVSFEAPGAGAAALQGTYVTAVNSKGQIAGQVLDAANVSHGFIRNKNGSFETFDIPGAGAVAYTGTSVNALGQDGSAIGTYIEASGRTHGYVRTPGGTVTTYDAPGATSTGLVRWRPNGRSIGIYLKDGTAHGFLLTE